jgi:hypothetical protein
VIVYCCEEGLFLDELANATVLKGEMLIFGKFFVSAGYQGIKSIRPIAQLSKVGNVL